MFAGNRGYCGVLPGARHDPSDESRCGRRRANDEAAWPTPPVNGVVHCSGEVIFLNFPFFPPFPHHPMTTIFRVRKRRAMLAGIAVKN